MDDAARIDVLDWTAEAVNYRLTQLLRPRCAKPDR